MDTQQKTFDLLESTGLNWSVNKEPLFAADGKATESFGIFRNDNKKWLGTVKKRYEPFQNSELAEMVVDAAASLNLGISRGGMLSGGQKVYIQLELPQEHIGNSDVKRWLSALNSHDGSTSIGFGSSNTTIVCQNTFFMAYGEIEKIRHTASAKERVQVMIKNMQRALGMDVKLMESFKRMAELPLNEGLVASLTASLFKVDVNTPQSEVSARRTNQITGFVKSVEKSIEEQGSTVWALFNGITRYTNHVAAPKDPEKKNDFLIVNGGAAFSRMGLDEILKYVERNTATSVVI